MRDDARKRIGVGEQYVSDDRRHNWPLIGFLVVRDFPIPLSVFFFVVMMYINHSKEKNNNEDDN
jgi:hypothetical protein